MMRPPPPIKNSLIFPPPLSDSFPSSPSGLMKTKRPKRKRKKPIFKFNDVDSMEFGKSNSMEFNRPNSMEFSVLNSPLPPKKSTNFEKSYDELVNSAKKLADTIENFSDNEDNHETINPEIETKDKKSTNSYESDKFNFDDEMRLSQKDEDDLDNLDNLSNLGDGNAKTNEKNQNGGENFNDFDSIEKNSYTTSSDADKFVDVFGGNGDNNGDKFSDLFKEIKDTNYKDGEDRYNDKYDDGEAGDNYDKLYDKIIDNITGNKKKDKKSSDKFGAFDESLFNEDDVNLNGNNGNHKKKSSPSSNGKKTKKKKQSDIDQGEDGSQFTNENTSDEMTSNKDGDDMKLTDNEQTEYNSNTSGHSETNDYDYAGYAKDPNEQSEEVVDNDSEKGNTGGSGGNNGNKSNGNNGGGDAGSEDKGQNDVKYQDDHTIDQQTTNSPSDHSNDYKEQTQSTGDERSFKHSTSFRNSFSNSFSNSFQPFTRLSMVRSKNSVISNKMNPLNTSNGQQSTELTKFNNINHFNNHFNNANNMSSNHNNLTGFNGSSRPTKKLIRVRSKRIRQQ